MYLGCTRCTVNLHFVHLARLGHASLNQSGLSRLNEQYLMHCVPCLQACAARDVANDLECRRLPVMCKNQGCNPQPVSLEDIKLLLDDGSKFETFCERALLLHVDQSPTLRRCPTVNCKQVWHLCLHCCSCALDGLATEGSVKGIFAGPYRHTQVRQQCIPVLEFLMHNLVD